MLSGVCYTWRALRKTGSKWNILQLANRLVKSHSRLEINLLMYTGQGKSSYYSSYKFTTTNTCQKAPQNEDRNF